MPGYANYSCNKSSRVYVCVCGRERGAKALEERLGSKSTIEVKESEVKGGGDIEAGVSTFLADATFATK